MDWTEIVPAVRMLASRNQLLSCRTVVKSEENAFDRVEDIKKVDNHIKTDRVLEVSSNVESVESYQSAFESWFKKNDTSPSAVLIKNQGAILLDSTDVSSSDIPVDHRVAGRIVVVTGGAQGFGGGIATSLYDYGAHV
ncbi:MAG: hypothetical protein R6U46_11000, partial [Marinilabilia sp.]